MNKINEKGIFARRIIMQIGWNIEPKFGQVFFFYYFEKKGKQIADKNHASLSLCFIALLVYQWSKRNSSIGIMDDVLSNTHCFSFHYFINVLKSIHI